MDTQRHCLHYYARRWWEASHNRTRTWPCSTVSNHYVRYCGSFQRYQLVHDDPRLWRIPPTEYLKVLFTLSGSICQLMRSFRMRVFVYTYLGFFVSSVSVYVTLRIGPSSADSPFVDHGTYAWCCFRHLSSIGSYLGIRL